VLVLVLTARRFLACRPFEAKRRYFQTLILVKYKVATFFGLLTLIVALCTTIAAKDTHELNESEAREALNLLSHLGYWTGDAEAASDEPTYFATLAFQRVVGIAPTGRLTQTELRLLRRAEPLRVRSPQSFHVEIDVKRQILFLVEPGGVTRFIVPISTGNGVAFRINGHTANGRTPLGTFQVYRKIDGWHDSSLGNMFYSSYIYRGIAVHGSRIFAKTPSTHGCISIPLLAAISLSKEMPMGTVVTVYD